MPLSKDDIKLFNRMNKRMNEFSNRGLNNEIINIVKNELTNIYLDESAKHNTDLSRTNFGKFSMNQSMSDETIDQLRGLAKALETNKSSRIGYYKKNPTVSTNAGKTYETLKGRTVTDEVTGESKSEYGVNNFQGFIDFVDNLNDAMENEKISEKLDSNQWAKIYGYGINKGLDESTINDLIERNLTSYINGDQFVLFAFNEIDKKMGKK